jgi:hypothetical protein
LLPGRSSIAQHILQRAIAVGQAHPFIDHCHIGLGRVIGRALAALERSSKSYAISYVYALGGS